MSDEEKAPVAPQRFGDSIVDFKVIDIVPAQMPQDFLIALGGISVAHAQLDDALRYCLKTIVGTSILETFFAFSDMTSRDLRDRVKKLAKKRLGDGRSLCKFEGLVNFAGELTFQRNTYVHAVWVCKVESGQIRRKTHASTAEPPSIQELHDIADGMVGLARELMAARSPGGFLHDALSKKPHDKVDWV